MPGKTADRKVYVIGHKNPDTDSICSAIAYAELKNKLTGKHYEAKRAGQLNEETQYILERFGVEPPALLSTVQAQVRDLDINRNPGVSGDMSIKEAWSLMKNNKMKTMPITRGDHLEGIISTGDIAKSYLDVYDSHILSTAGTKYLNIIRTIDGEMITGDEQSCIDNGKVVIAASSPEKMEEFIEKDDLVILGNRYESQLCAIELQAGCIIVCQGAEVSRTIIKMAQDNGVSIITTPHDTFTVARLINQSIPVKYFMTTEDLCTFSVNEFVDDIKETMANQRFRDFPVLDKKGRFIGLISRRRMLNIFRKQVILVDHNEKSQAVNGIEEADILEIIDHHRLGALETLEPVYFRNIPVGSTATIIYIMYHESGTEISAKIASLLCAAILSDTLMFRSPTCTPTDQKAAEEMAAAAGLDIQELASSMFHAGSNLQNKTAREICFQDFKKFDVSGVQFGVGQLNLIDAGEISEIEKRLSPELENIRKEQHLDMLFFMLTNIVQESTRLLCSGEGAKDQMISAFDLPPDTDSIVLKGVVSRKKQLIPDFVISLQQ